MKSKVQTDGAQGPRLYKTSLCAARDLRALAGIPGTYEMNNVLSIYKQLKGGGAKIFGGLTQIKNSSPLVSQDFPFVTPKKELQKNIDYSQCYKHLCDGHFRKNTN